jgi:hypothetical protein
LLPKPSPYVDSSRSINTPPNPSDSQRSVKMTPIPIPTDSQHDSQSSIINTPSIPNDNQSSIINMQPNPTDSQRSIDIRPNLTDSQTSFNITDSFRSSSMNLSSGSLGVTRIVSRGESATKIHISGVKNPGVHRSGRNIAGGSGGKMVDAGVHGSGNSLGGSGRKMEDAGVRESGNSPGGSGRKIKTDAYVRRSGNDLGGSGNDLGGSGSSLGGSGRKMTDAYVRGSGSGSGNALGGSGSSPGGLGRKMVDAADLFSSGRSVGKLKEQDLVDIAESRSLDMTGHDSD